jgi:peptide/nickel transport system substrate-binding protein
MTNPTANRPVGTGPFKFVSWDRGQSIRLDRNDKYWNPGLPYLNRILIRFIPDAATRSAALETGEVHLAAQNAVSFPDLARMKNNRSLELTTKGYETAPYMSMLELNSRRAPFDKKGVRQAIAYAIDRQFIADNVFYGYARPATGPLSSLLSLSGFYTADVRRYDVPDRLAIANKLLDDAGLPRKNGGMRFSARIEVNPFGEQWVRQAEYIKQALAVIGIDIQLRSEDTPTWLRRVYTDYDYDINEPFVSNGVDPIIGLERLYTTSQIRKGVTFVNNTFYSNPDLDALLSRARIELDNQKRADMYKSAQKTLVEDSPLIWLNEVQFVTVSNRKLHDHTMGPWGINQAFDRAWLEK